MASLLAEYHAFLTDNRRMSPHSVRAYQATAERLSGFLERHWGGAVDRTGLVRISAGDLRAFLADRRVDGLTIGKVAANAAVVQRLVIAL